MFFSSPSYSIYPPSRINEIVLDVGQWLLFSGIIGFISLPFYFRFLLNILFLGNPIHHPEYYFEPYPLSLIAIMIIICALIVKIVAIFNARKLTAVVKSDHLNVGVTLITVGSSLMLIIFFFIVLVGFIALCLQMKEILFSLDTVWSSYISLFYVIVVISIITDFLGRFLIGILFWRMGVIEDSIILIIGAAIFIVSGEIGMGLLAMGLLTLSLRGRNVLSNDKLLETIREELSKDLRLREKAYVKHYSRQYRVPLYLLVSIIRFWISIGEIEGVLVRDVLLKSVES